MQIHCLRCKQITDTIDVVNDTDKRGKSRVKGRCVTCGTMKYKYVKSGGAMPAGASLDIHKAIGKLPRPKGGFTLPGYKYCGPYNPLDEQVDSEGNLIDEPKNEIDRVCAVHDMDYDKAESKQDKHIADKKMLDSLKKVKPKSFREKVDRAAIRAVIGTKYKLGLGVRSGGAKKNGKVE